VPYTSCNDINNIIVDQPPQEEPQVGEGEEGEEEDLVLMLQKFPRTPQPWESFGSEVEVEEENVVENRPKVSSCDQNHL